jgi:hypothetical protein
MLKVVVGPQFPDGSEVMHAVLPGDGDELELAGTATVRS